MNGRGGQSFFCISFIAVFSIFTILRLGWTVSVPLHAAVAYLMMLSSVAEQNKNDQIECLHQTTWVWGGNVVSEPHSRSEITHDHPEHRVQSWSPLFLIHFSALYQHFGCWYNAEIRRRKMFFRCLAELSSFSPLSVWNFLLQLIKLATRTASFWFWLSAVEYNSVGCCRNAAFLFRKRWWSLIS